MDELHAATAELHGGSDNKTTEKYSIFNDVGQAPAIMLHSDG